MQSEKIDLIADALSKVQAALKPAAKDGNNPHFGSSFATLASVWDAARDLLGTNGLAAIQGVRTEEGQPRFFTLIAHKSGQWIRSEIVPFVLTKQDPQGIGSALTYYRRYGLAAALGVTQDDDDGAAATAGKGAGKVSSPPPPAAPQFYQPDMAIKQMEEAKNAAGLKAIYEREYKRKAKYSAESWAKIEAVKNIRKAELSKGGK